MKNEITNDGIAIWGCSGYLGSFYQTETDRMDRAEDPATFDGTMTEQEVMECDAACIESGKFDKRGAFTKEKVLSRQQKQINK